MLWQFRIRSLKLALCLGGMLELELVWFVLDDSYML